MCRVSSGKSGSSPAVEALLPVDPGRQQLAPPVIEPLVQFGDEAERRFGQNLGGTGQRRGRRLGQRTVEDRAHPCIAS